jgi:hypothetical protein
MIEMVTKRKTKKRMMMTSMSFHGSDRVAEASESCQQVIEASKRCERIKMPKKGVNWAFLKINCKN